MFFSLPSWITWPIFYPILKGSHPLSKKFLFLISQIPYDKKKGRWVKVCMAEDLARPKGGRADEG
jgi:hypothetical protein